MIHLLLFDVDGTLILTGGAGIRAFQRAFHELFRREVETDGIRFHGRTDPEIIEDIFAAGLSRSPTPEELQAICSRYLAHLEEEVRHSPGFRIPDPYGGSRDSGVSKGIPRIVQEGGGDRRDSVSWPDGSGDHRGYLCCRAQPVPDPRGAPSDLQPVSRPPRRGGASLARLPHHAGTPPPIGDACRSG